MSAGRCLLKNGILWDTKKMVDILIDDERIVQIVPGQSLGAVDARIIDLTGKTILPGFFNAHVHLYGVRGPLPDELLHRFVLGGVTTVRDMGVSEVVDATDWARIPFCVFCGKVHLRDKHIWSSPSVWRTDWICNR